MIDPTTIDEAANRIEPHVLRTPLLTSDPLSERHGADIAIKCEQPLVNVVQNKWMDIDYHTTSTTRISS